MAQGILPFTYQEEKKDTGMTALAGLPVHLDLARIARLSKLQKHLKVWEGGQGWTDSQMVISLVLLNLAGGDCVEDIKILEGDDGFCEVLRKTETHGLKRKIRRALERRWRKERRHSLTFGGISLSVCISRCGTGKTSADRQSLYPISERAFDRIVGG